MLDLCCCGGYSLVVVPSLLIAMASFVVEHRLSSYGAWAWLLFGMWDSPGSGMEPVDSSFLSHQGSPLSVSFNILI